jgi:hypothetical protein
MVRFDPPMLSLMRRGLMAGPDAFGPSAGRRVRRLPQSHGRQVMPEPTYAQLRGNRKGEIRETASDFQGVALLH